MWALKESLGLLTNAIDSCWVVVIGGIFQGKSGLHENTMNFVLSAFNTSLYTLIENCVLWVFNMFLQHFPYDRGHIEGKLSLDMHFWVIFIQIVALK